MLYSQSIVKTLINGGIGVLPTDTLYGLVGQALSKKAVKFNSFIKENRSFSGAKS